MIGVTIVSLVVSVYCLNTVRFVSGGSLGGNEADANDEIDQSDNVSTSQSEMIEARGATLTFQDVNYYVKASTTKDKLHLLKDINGYFEKGKVCFCLLVAHMSVPSQ